LAKQKAQATECMSNIRQVSIAVFSYVQDSKGWYPANEEGDYTPNDLSTVLVKPWVNGWENYEGGSEGADGGLSDTDTAYLTSATFTSVGPYIVAPKIFRCPADFSCAYGQTGAPRVRSYSMNQAIGCAMDNSQGGGNSSYAAIGAWLPGVPSGGPWLIYPKDSDMTRPSPANLWMLLDEHPDSINDGAFAVQMPTESTQATWIDHASALHGGGCAFSFCDGHALIKKWRDPQWKLDLRYPPDYTTTWGQTIVGSGGEYPNSSPIDLFWVAAHTSANENAAQGYPFPVPADY
jgi:prepilin-type processing-associated H-X9-DG protein